MNADDQPSISCYEGPDAILYLSLTFPADVLRQLSSEDAKQAIYQELERAYQLLLSAL